MNIIERIFGRENCAHRNPNDERPVKLVQERENVWRVVYAD